ncbi:MAG TPA: dihydrodipicolinate reductase C-terminal domain-containing protein [Thermoanaerobaculia bacterium]|nr:dihydrodipicolinate reductase C-terminal domain-containing protein [Thermoanaerobaculia bacterium]
MRALIVGYGKMGKAIEAALAAKGHAVAGKIDEGDRPEDSAPCDVAFEFTTPASAEKLVVFLLSKRIPVISGTTGWEIAPAVRVAREQKTPFLHSPNFSIGVAVMKRLAAQAAALLFPFSSFQPGILERHHAAKKDAPSGTAKLLASAVDAARPGAPVPVVALRQGGQPGEHALFFEGESECLEIVHRARSRAIFAAGAVAAAEWLLASDRRGPVTFDEFLDAVSRERTSR